MFISIGSRNVTISKALRAFIREQLTERLQRFATAILAAKVELSDRNGRRGGSDKRCRIELTLAKGDRLVQDDIQANARNAFRCAMNRAETAVHRQLRLSI